MNEAGSWSRGYPVHEAYPASWHGFQSPAHLKLVCALNGVAWDVDAQTPLCIAEVGCGTGYTALMLAAGNPQAQVIGLDYNPAHIAEARDMAAAAGLGNVQFLEADVSELARPGHALLGRLPEFDLVTAHGLWSWVSDDVRQGLLALLRTRLKAGGLALVSYNALPGAAGALGLSRLVRQALNAQGDTADGLDAAGRLVQGLVQAGAPHLPDTAWRRMLMGDTPGTRAGYLLHEFSTRHWRPSFHADVAAALEDARCDYVGSASLDENLARLSLSEAQMALWAQAPDARARELVFDLCVPRPFRRDLYVRGLRRVPSETALGAQRLVLTRFLAQGQGEQPAAQLRTQQGVAGLPAELVEQVCTALARGPQRIADLQRLPGCAQAGARELAITLVGSGLAMPLWRMPGSGAGWAEARAAAQRLNAVAAQRLAPHGVGGAQFGLATAVLGGGLQVSALELAVAQRLQAWPGPGQPTAQDIVASLLPAGLAAPQAVQAELQSLIERLLPSAPAVWRQLHILDDSNP